MCTNRTTVAWATQSDVSCSPNGCLCLPPVSNGWGKPGWLEDDILTTAWLFQGFTTNLLTDPLSTIIDEKWTIDIIGPDWSRMQIPDHSCKNIETKNPKI